MPGGDPQVARMLNEVYSNHPANPNHPNNPLNKARRIYDLWEREDDIFARQRGLMPDPGAVEAPKGRGRFLWRFFRGKIAKAWTAKEILELPLLPLEMGFAYEAHMRRMGEAQVFTAFSRLKGTVGEERYCQALERHAEAWGYSVDRHNWGVRSKEFSAGGSPVYWYYFPIEASAEWYHATDPEEWLSVYGIPELDAATIMYNWDQQRYRGVETLSPLEVLNR